MAYMMSTLYGEPLLFKSKYGSNRSGSIQALSSTTKVEDGHSTVHHLIEVVHQTCVALENQKD